MVFNGHTEQYIESLDEELFTEIQVMYADGLLGNKGIFDALTPITTAVYNYFRSAQSPTIHAADIFPWVQEYSINPDTEPTQEEKVNNSLLAFMSQAQGFKPELFKK
jgi:hypothetical protein